MQHVQGIASIECAFFQRKIKHSLEEKEIQRTKLCVGLFIPIRKEGSIIVWSRAIYIVYQNACSSFRFNT